MKCLGYLFFLPLIGFSNALDYCPSQATGCEGCSAKWDYNNITSVVYTQTNGKCTAIFTWSFEYQPDDSNPWLQFICEYAKTGEICNSRNDTTCASCLTYTITDLDALHDPYVIFYDSCNNFFDVSLTQPCVNAVDETTKNPITNPVYSTTLGTQTSSPPNITEISTNTSHHPVTTHAQIITSQYPPTSEVTKTTTEKIQTTQFPVSTTHKQRTTHPSNKPSTPISTTYKPIVTTLEPKTSQFPTEDTTVTSRPSITTKIPSDTSGLPVTTHALTVTSRYPTTTKIIKTTTKKIETTQPPVSTTTQEQKTTQTFTKTSTLPITTHEAKTSQIPTGAVTTVTSNSPFTGTHKPYCPEYHECHECPKNYKIPSFTQYAQVHGNGECTVTFTWKYPYEENIRMEFLCHYIDGKNCHTDEPYVCGSCEEFIIHNIKNYEEPILEYLDSCENRIPIFLTQDCY